MAAIGRAGFHGCTGSFAHHGTKAPPVCTVCQHPERFRIELLRAGGAGIDALAKKFKVSRDAVFRHWQRHVPDNVKQSYLAGPGDLETFATKAAEEGDSILDYLRLCRGILVAQLAAANEAGDQRTAAYVADKLRAMLETIAKVTGELGSMASSINITNNVAILHEHPAWLRTQAAVLKALSSYPEARAAVVVALRDLDQESAPAARAVPAIGKVIEHAAA